MPIKWIAITWCVTLCLEKIDGMKYDQDMALYLLIYKQGRQRGSSSIPAWGFGMKGCDKEYDLSETNLTVSNMVFNSF